ncbi:MAG: hypothetical protein WC709_10165 [Thermoleophilia bacterium]
MKPSAPFVTVVSGSPRNGTALMMHMLLSGGLEVLVDGAHRPGEPDPHGYFDYAPSLMLDVESSTSDWVASAQGMAVKVMPYQLQYLSPAFDYRVVFVCREVGDVLDSWEAMGLVRAAFTPREGEADQAAGIDSVAFEAKLLRQPRLRTLFVRYLDLTADPAEQAARVAAFLGLPLDAGAMAAAADATRR